MIGENDNARFPFPSLDDNDGVDSRESEIKSTKIHLENRFHSIVYVLLN